MAAHQRLAGLANGGLHLMRSDSLNVDQIREAGQSCLQVVRIGWWRIGPIYGRLLLGWRRDTQHLAFGRREWGHQDIILVLAERRLALGGEEADDPQRHALDLDKGADWILPRAEEL